MVVASKRWLGFRSRFQRDVWSESCRPESAVYRHWLHGGTKAREVRFSA